MVKPSGLKQKFVFFARFWNALVKKSSYRAEYNQFKKKSNSEFEDFKTQVETLGKEDFAVEDDLMDWEFATNALKCKGKVQNFAWHQFFFEK